jgi:60 kDa SS-A/Ro ribonucleoprotein
MSYLKGQGTRQTPQRSRARADQIENSEGGFVFQLDEWATLRRFLILGSASGTYYVGRRKMTEDCVALVLACVQADGVRAVTTAVAVSRQGLAPRNDEALFVLAAALALSDDDAGRELARKSLPAVARTGTHLFTFLEYLKGFRGWGRGARAAVANWYESKEPERLAYQLAKYRQRGGWSHADAMRLAHPRGLDPNLVNFARGVPFDEGAYKLLDGFTAAQKETDPKRVAELVAEYRLTHEMLPSEALASPDVWDALLQDMPLTAMIRNLGRMSALGMLGQTSEDTKLVVSRLADGDVLQKARVHPFQILLALTTYSAGRGVRGGLSWQPHAKIADALDGAFYATFKNVAPTGKRHLLALDVSSSMHGSWIADTHLTAATGAAAMALVTANVEPDYAFVGFTAGRRSSRYHGYGMDPAISPLTISPRQRLENVVRYTNSIGFGGTDCALPMLWATEKQLEFDTFVIYTDSETWAGGVHPFQALQQYRQRMVADARLIVVGMTSTRFTIADPSDPGMLDVVGFDSSAPRLMAEFSRGEV